MSKNNYSLQSGYKVGTYSILLVAPVSRLKNTHRHIGCGWLASRSGSKYEKKHIIAEDVVGLQVGDSKNDSLTKMKTY
jgi:hypothetical protein